MSLTVIILTKNDSSNIFDCIDSVRGVDEILVIDDFSSDNTVAMAESRGALVFQHALNENILVQRNFAMSMASGDWVFFLEPDECFNTVLKEAVLRHMKNKIGTAGAVVRHNFAFGVRQRFGPLAKDLVTRLLPKEATLLYDLKKDCLVTDLKVSILDGNLDHFIYQQEYRQLDEWIRNSILWADEAHKRGFLATPLKAITRATAVFFKMFFIKLGIFGGPVTWALCWLYSGYTMAKYLRLSEMIQREKEKEVGM